MNMSIRLPMSVAAMAVTLFLSGPGQGQAQTSTCNTSPWDLTAAQRIRVGTVTVCNDANNLYVTYALTYPGATFGTLHVWAGNDLLNVPANPNGTPVPGRFCQALGGRCYDAAGLTAHTFAIPFSDLNIVDATLACGSSVYVVTHAEVAMDSNGDGIPDQETAFGGRVAGGGPRWWFYGEHAILCSPGAIPVGPAYQTAFAKGSHVWTTAKQSNPENLPSLGLTKNRWGWAINLPGPGAYAYPIWAGAGLNHTSKGTCVGLLSVNYDGARATVRYDMAPGFLMEEVHLYARDAAPTTLAPGQYGYTNEFDPGVQSYSFTVPLADTDGRRGVWLIAHAVVSGVF